LREARTRKGLSPGDLAQSLNLDLRIVELIEANRLDEAPEPIYVRAYLKHWAGLLETDAAQLLAAFEAQRTINPRTDSLNTHARAPFDVMSSRKTTHRNPRARGGQVWGWLATLLIIAGALTVAVLALPSAWQQRISSLIGIPQGQGTSLNSPQLSSEHAPIAIEIPMHGSVDRAPSGTTEAASPAGTSPAAVSADTTTNGSTESSNTPLSSGLPPPPPLGAQESPALSSTKPAVATPPDNAPSLQTPAPVTAQVPPPVSSADNNLVIKVNNADCWVEVQDAMGKRLIYDVLKKGSERSLPGAGPFSVILGNPNAVTITWKGEPVKLGTPNATTGVVRTKVGG
jgi:cytoskeleton protein RodZ